jgi:hypothetical protein
MVFCSFKELNANAHQATMSVRKVIAEKSGVYFFTGIVKVMCC